MPSPGSGQAAQPALFCFSSRAAGYSFNHTAHQRLQVTLHALQAARVHVRAVHSDDMRQAVTCQAQTAPQQGSQLACTSTLGPLYQHTSRGRQAQRMPGHPAYAAVLAAVPDAGTGKPWMA